MKTHTCAFDIHIKSIKIQIKFPCSLVASFRLGKQEVQTKNTVKLEKGQAIFKETLSIKGVLTFDIEKKKYCQKKGTITVYVISNSGRNVAGLLHLDVSKKMNDPQAGLNIEKNLQRCPDKNARIRLDMIGRFTGQTELQESNSANISFYSVGKGNRQLSIESASNRSSGVQDRSLRPQSTSMEHIQHFHSHEGLRISKVDNVQSFQLRNAYDSAIYLQASRREDVDKSKTISQLRMEITQKDRRITRLEIEKTSFQKQADLLKIQMTNLKGKIQTKTSKQNELTFQNQRLNKKVSMLQSNIDSLKSSKVDFKRLESFSTKYSSQELAHRSQRLDELELEYRNLKTSKQQVERILREQKRQLRQTYEKSQDLQNSLTTLQKRIELKQSFYKEQLKKYNEKQIELEDIKLDLSNTNYALKDQLEQTERRLAATLKEKDKLLGDEKLRYNRKNQEIKTQIEVLRSQLEASSAKLSKIEDINDLLQKTIKQKDQQRLHLKQQIERAKLSSVEHENQLKRKHHDELNVHFEQLKQKHQIKYQQLEDMFNSKNTELQNSNRMLNDKSEHVKVFNVKVNDLQKKLKEKQQKNIEITQSLQTVSKRLELTRKNQERINAEIDQLKLTYNRTKLELERANREKVDLESYNAQSKQHHTQLVNQLKCMIKNITEELELTKNTHRIIEQEQIEFIQQIEQLKDRVQGQNLSLFQLSQRQGILSEQVMSKNMQLKKSEDDNQNLKLIISEQKQLYDKECVRSLEFQARISRLQEESHQFAFISQQIKRLEKNIKDKEAELKLKYESQSKLQLTIQKQQYQIQSFQEEIKSRMNEIHKEKNLSEIIKKQVTALKEQLENVKKSDQSKGEEINKLQLEKFRFGNEKKLLEDKIQSITQDFKREKQQWFDRFREFLNSINRDQHSTTSISISQPMNLQEFIKDAYSKLHTFKQLQHRNALNKIEVIQDQLERTKAQTSEIMKDKQTQLLTKYQVSQQNHNLYKQSVRRRELETDEQIITLKQNLQECMHQLNRSVQEKSELTANYHNALIKIEQLSAHLEQTHRQMQRMIDERNLIGQELEQQRIDKSLQVRKINEESNNRLQLHETNMLNQITQLERQIKQKKKIADNLQSENRTLSKDFDQKVEMIKLIEKRNEQLVKQIENTRVETSIVFKKQHQLYQKIRYLQQSIQLSEEKVQQNTFFSQLRQKELEDIKVKFEKEKDKLMRKISSYETELRNIQISHQSNFQRINQENIFLRQEIDKSGRHSSQQLKRKEEEITHLSKELSNKRNQLIFLQNQYNEHKREAQYSARVMRDEIQRHLQAVQSLQKRLGNMNSQLKLMEDKCTSLENEKRVYEAKIQQSSLYDSKNLELESSRLQEELQIVSNRLQSEVNDHERSKTRLLAEIQQLTFYFQEKSRQIAEHYDRQIRQLTARMISATNDADERIKRVYQEKYEDRSALEFEIHCLRQELSKYTQVRVEKNPLCRDEFIMEVSDTRMRLLLSQEPLRNIESWIPSLINQVRQYEETIYAHERHIKELQEELQTTARRLESHIQPLKSSRAARKSTFFPLSIVRETFKGSDGSSFTQKLSQILSNVQIALRRVQDLASALESVTQDKIILLTKTRQVYNGLLHNRLDYVRDELSCMLDYSKIQAGTFYVRVSKPS